MNFAFHTDPFDCCTERIDRTKLGVEDHNTGKLVRRLLVSMIRLIVIAMERSRNIW